MWPGCCEEPDLLHPEWAIPRCCIREHPWDCAGEATPDAGDGCEGALGTDLFACNQNAWQGAEATGNFGQVLLTQPMKVLWWPLRLLRVLQDPYCYDPDHILRLNGAMAEIEANATITVEEEFGEVPSPVPDSAAQDALESPGVVQDAPGAEILGQQMPFLPLKVRHTHYCPGAVSSLCSPWQPSFEAYILPGAVHPQGSPYHQVPSRERLLAPLISHGLGSHCTLAGERPHMVDCRDATPCLAALADHVGGGDPSVLCRPPPV